MTEFISFFGYVVSKVTQMLFNLSLGRYSYGALMVTILVIDIFVSSIVLSFGKRISSGISSPSRGHGSSSGESGE